MGMSELRVKTIILPHVAQHEREISKKKRQAAALPRVLWATAMRGAPLHLGIFSLCWPCRPHGPVPRILRCTAAAHARKELEGN